MMRKLLTATGLAAAMVLLLYLPAAAMPKGAQEAQAAPGIPLMQAALVAAGYWLSNSAFLANLGFTVFRWPLVAGPIVGLIMGDVQAGIVIGATINTLYLGTVVVGAAQATDPSLPAWLGTAWAISGHLAPAAATTIAAGLGIVGLLGFYGRMNVDIAFVRRADAYAERADIAGVARANWVPGQIVMFLFYFIPGFIVAYFGSVAFNQLFLALNPFAGGPWSWIADWFLVAGSLLALVGIAVNLNLIWRGEIIPYFVIGFTVSALTGINLVAMALLAGSLAALHIYFTRRPHVTAGNP